MSLQRVTKSQTVSVTDSLATTEEIRWSAGCFGMIHIPTGSSITSLTWYCAPAYSGTYTPANNENSVATTQTVADGQCYQVPVAVSGAMALKVVGDDSGDVSVVHKS